MQKIVTNKVKYPEYLSDNAKNFIDNLLQKIHLIETTWKLFWNINSLSKEFKRLEIKLNLLEINKIEPKGEVSELDRSIKKKMNKW